MAGYLALCREDAKQREHSLRAVFNGLRYIVKTGNRWRMIPHDLPPWPLVYRQTQRWIRAECFEVMVEDLRSLLRDLTQHEKRPSAFLIYLHLWRHSFGEGRKVVALSHRQLAEGTGLSKSAVQAAVRLLKRRKLLSVARKHPTAIPVYPLERPWIRRKQGGKASRRPTDRSLPSTENRGTRAGYARVSPADSPCVVRP